MDSRRTVVGVLALLVVLAGCAGAGLDGSTGGEPSGGEPSREGQPVGSGTAVDGATYEVTVVSVVDGDTIDVAYPNGTTERVRLLGVDTPEVHVENDPAEFEGVPDTAAGRDCLRAAGEDATAAVRARLADREVTLVVDPAADRRGGYGRLLAYVRVNGTDLNRWLLAEGHARVYDSTFSRSEEYYATESEAQEAGRGVWECRSPTRDGDETGHVYEFPHAFTLEPGGLVTLHTGSGTDTATDLYWGQSGAVWNNGGDTVTVRDANGTVVLRRGY